MAATSALLVPTDREVFGVCLYTFWWTSFLLFLVVLWNERSQDIRWRLVSVLLGGLSSPVIFLITPFLLFADDSFQAEAQGGVLFRGRCLLLRVADGRDACVEGTGKRND